MKFAISTPSSMPRIIHGVTKVAEVKRLKVPLDENAMLKKLLADSILNKEAL